MKYLAIFALLALSGCGTTFLTKEKPMVIMPDHTLFECPTTVSIPPAETLTDIQVAEIIIELKTNLEICANKNKSIEAFLTAAKKRLEQ